MQEPISTVGKLYVKYRKLHSLRKVYVTYKGKVVVAYLSKAHGIMLYFSDEKQNLWTITEIMYPSL